MSGIDVLMLIAVGVAFYFAVKWRKDVKDARIKKEAGDRPSGGAQDQNDREDQR